MIGRLKGVLDARVDGTAVLDVGGVGYEVEGAPRLMESLPSDGEEVTLVIDVRWRDDRFRLFAFADELEREWFRLLNGVRGVGVKVALAVQGVLSSAELARAVVAGDEDALLRAPGVGPKAARRIVRELADLVPDSRAARRIGGERGGDGPERDAVSVLSRLGYRRSEIAHALAAVRDADAASSDGASEDAASEDAGALVRRALRVLGG